MNNKYSINEAMEILETRVQDFLPEGMWKEYEAAVDRIREEVSEKARKYDGENKTTSNLTFTLNYADGTKMEVEDGVLFSINSDDTMDIHVGVSKLYQLFGVYFCFMEFITDRGMIPRFDRYVKSMMESRGITDVKKDD